MSASQFIRLHREALDRFSPVQATAKSAKSGMTGKYEQCQMERHPYSCYIKCRYNANRWLDGRRARMIAGMGSGVKLFFFRDASPRTFGGNNDRSAGWNLSKTPTGFNFSIPKYTTTARQAFSWIGHDVGEAALALLKSYTVRAEVTLNEDPQLHMTQGGVAGLHCDSCVPVANRGSILGSFPANQMKKRKENEREGTREKGTTPSTRRAQNTRTRESSPGAPATLERMGTRNSGVPPTTTELLLWY
ncbi:hypothetical protein K438DRAFT_1767776 [Mycena galopus ATCC 62051]|nr:hypothetical protein K438DRAFT_1767776 [Mycena galopus ATCC 62051]